MHVLKFRAECKREVSELQKILPKTTFKVKHWKKYFPDVIVTLITEYHIELVRQYMYYIEDSLVMIQTLAKASEYTGRRIPRPLLIISVN